MEAFMQRTFCTTVVAVLMSTLLAAPAFAQTGRIQGKVTDEAGKPVDGAKITVSTIPDAGGQKWEATSDKNGNYIIGTLPKSGGDKGQSHDLRCQRERKSRISFPSLSPARALDPRIDDVRARA